MGFLKKLGASMGHVDHHLIEHGLLARGKVVQCRRTSMSTGNQVPSVVCELTVEVELEDRPVYTASCRHPIQMPYLPQFESEQAFVAVRVDPADPQNIALDLQHDVPPPRGGAMPMSVDNGAQVIYASQGIPPDVAQQLAAAGITIDPNANVADVQVGQNRVSPVSAAEILATGTPCRVVIQSATPMGMKKDGNDVWGFVLNVLEGTGTTQARVGMGVPAAAMPLIFPGANLPAKHRSDVPDGVAIDWVAAMSAGGNPLA